MDTVARHPLTALAVVAAFLAVALWSRFGAEPPPPPEPPPRPTIDVLDPGVGESAEYRGRVMTVGPGAPSRVVGESRPPAAVLLDLGSRQATCLFPAAGTAEAFPVADLRAGDVVTVRGRVEAVEHGRIHLRDCTVVFRWK